VLIAFSISVSAHLPLLLAGFLPFQQAKKFSNVGSAQPSS
jgi:hypothetical protein